MLASFSINERASTQRFSSFRVAFVRGMLGISLVTGALLPLLLEIYRFNYTEAGIYSMSD
jgi:hypothetical protein